MPPGKGDRVVPPRLPGEWDARYADKKAADGWEDVCRAAPSGAQRAWEILRNSPETPANRDRQHRLKGELGSRMVQGKNLPQWQYEVTGGIRIWYCPDEDRQVVWLTFASASHHHPKATE